MATPRIAYAEQLRDSIRQILDDQGLPDAVASIDAREISSGARDGIVVISPPDLTFPTYDQTESAYELSVIAGPADNLLEAWRTLDAILEALRRGGIPLVSAQGDMFRPTHGDPLPGYSVTLAPALILDESEPS